MASMRVRPSSRPGPGAPLSPFVPFVPFVAVSSVRAVGAGVSLIALRHPVGLRPLRAFRPLLAAFERAQDGLAQRLRARHERADAVVDECITDRHALRVFAHDGQRHAEVFGALGAALQRAPENVGALLLAHAEHGDAAAHVSGRARAHRVERPPVVGEQEVARAGDGLDGVADRRRRVGLEPLDVDRAHEALARRVLRQHVDPTPRRRAFHTDHFIRAQLHTRPYLREWRGRLLDAEGAKLSAGGRGEQPLAVARDGEPQWLCRKVDRKNGVRPRAGERRDFGRGDLAGGAAVCATKSHSPLRVTAMSETSSPASNSAKRDAVGSAPGRVDVRLPDDDLLLGRGGRVEREHLAVARDAEAILRAGRAGGEWKVVDGRGARQVLHIDDAQEVVVGRRRLADEVEEVAARRERQIDADAIDVEGALKAVVLRVVDEDLSGVGGGEHVEALRVRVERDARGRVEADGGRPLETRAGGLVVAAVVVELRQLVHEPDAQLVALADAAGLAGALVAAAVGVERGHEVRLALGVAERDEQVLQPVLAVAIAVAIAVAVAPAAAVAVAAPLPGGGREIFREVYVNLLADENLAAAAVERQPRLDDDEAVAAVGVRVLCDAQAADRPPAVQVAVVQPVLAEQVLLLVAEVALDAGIGR